MESAAPAKRSAIVTVAIGAATERLDYTFLSFAQQNPGVPLHAFIIGSSLPERRFDPITYHLVPPIPDYSHPLREVYFRRHSLIDDLAVDYALVVDCYDVLCLQPLPPLEELVGAFALAACVEQSGSRFVLGQGYTSNFLNGGVTFWNVGRSRDIRREIAERGRTHFRTVADDQYVINEVVQTKYFREVRILPCQYNFRANYKFKQRGWPTVESLDGVVLYHNAISMNSAKASAPFRTTAELPALPSDGGPLNRRDQFWRRLRTRLAPHIAK